MNLTIRPATPADLPLVARLIRALADYEKLAHEVRFDETVLGQKLFGPRPYAEVVIGEVDGVAQGFALFFHNFSTFEGKPGIYLEDLFVQPEARGSGMGKALLAHLAIPTEITLSILVNGERQAPNYALRAGDVVKLIPLLTGG